MTLPADKTLATREDLNNALSGVCAELAELRAELAEIRKDLRALRRLILIGFIGGFGLIIAVIIGGFGAIIAKLYFGV